MTEQLPAIAHPETGEVLDGLDRQPPELLAHALDVVRRRIDEHQAAARALEAELRNRLKILDRASTTFGEWKISAKPKNTRIWSAEDLRGVLEELVERDVIRAGEIPDGIIVTEQRVAGKVALELRGQLGPEAQAAIDKAWRWKSERGQLTVTPAKKRLEASAPADELEASDRDAGDSEEHEQQDQKDDHVDEQVQRVGSHDTGSARPLEQIPGQLDFEELFA